MSHSKKEYTGKNVDEAIAAACVSCKCRQEDLEIEVVSSGSTGIFGLGKRKAVILASRKAKVKTVIEPKRPPVSGGADGAVASAPGPQTSRRQTPPREREARPPRERESRHDEGVNSEPLAAESLAGIGELLSTTLRLMGFAAEVSVTATGNRVTASIASDGDAADIVGRNGATIDAIQYLLRKIITQRFPEKIHLTLDVGSYRADRQKELTVLALELAAKVKETGKSQMLGALNSAERRIIHLTLQEDREIRSASVGDGLFKKVRISLPGQGRKPANGPGREQSLREEDSTEP